MLAPSIFLGLGLLLAQSPTSSAQHPVADTTADPVQEAVSAAKRALQAYKAADYPTAVLEGQAALAVLGPNLGWENESVVLLAGVTVDSLVKLGRNDEAQALANKVKQAQAGSPTPTPTKTDDTPESPETRASRLAGEGMIAVQQGRYAESVTKGQAAIDVLEREAPNSTLLFPFRTMLATLHSNRLEFDEAEALLSANLKKARTAGDDEQLHETLTALGRLATSRGELDAAERFYGESLQVAERLGTPETRAASLGGLADVAVGRERPGEAIPLLQEALTLQEKRFKVGANHLLAPALALGEAFELAGRFAEAEPMLLRAQGIVEREFGLESPAGWRVRTQLGRLYRSMGRYDHAIEILGGVLAEQEAILPPTSPGAAATMNHLAETLWAKGGEPRRTIGLATRAAQIQELATARVVTGGTEQEKRAYLERYVSGTDRIITYAVDEVPTDPDAARLAVNTILRRKGRVLDAVSGQLEAARSRLAPEAAAKLEALSATQSRISALVLSGAPQGKAPAEYNKTLADLREDAKRLERELSSVESVRLTTETIELAAVQAAIPNDAVLVEIACYRKFDVRYDSFSKAFGAARYVAYVIERSGPPRMVDLGPAAPIETATQNFRRALADPRTNVSAIGRNLDALTMAKIRPLLGKHQRVLVSPDGQLNLVPFAALVDEKNRYLIEKLEFTYLSSGRDLLRLATDHGGDLSGPVIVGAPAFSAAGSGQPSSARSRSADMSAEMFSPLPATKTEAEAIAKSLDTQPLLGAAATESAIKNLSKPVLLHIATHGFFLADGGGQTAGARGVTYKKKAAGAWVPPRDDENPLIRSGLALTGANVRSAPDGEDGILTALEVAHLDLVGTQLVVLSACETGVGDVQNGEGVYGLRRALVLAGSRSQVMSLWQVDDDATRDLMLRYYKRLEKDNGRSESLRASQLRMLGKKDSAHPYYWAAFIPSGDWRAIDLEPAAEAKPKRERRTYSGDWTWDSMTQELDSQMMVFYGGYSRPLQAQQHDGAPAKNDNSFDLRLRFFQRSIIGFGLDYSRHLWESPESPRALRIPINKFELVAELDLLAMPPDWRVRLGLHPYLGGGLAWGRQDRLRESLIAVAGATPQRDLMGGIGITFGTDAALYFRLSDKVALQLRGGIAKPMYRMRADGDRLDYDDTFPRAWRWQGGLGIGALPQ